VFGNLKTPAIAVDAVRDALSTYLANGYTETEGSAEARGAVAEIYESEEFRLTKSDVFLANGGSGALWMAIGSVCPRGSNILLPKPGFTYCVASASMEVECRYYDCLVLSLFHCLFALLALFFADMCSQNKIGRLTWSNWRV
jgi:aspartate/methionine/tyrosine aminotransferase